MPYYFCAYGDRIRFAKQPNAAAAARYCFGVEDNVTTIELPKAPRYLPHRVVNQLKLDLKFLHKQRTGNEVEL